jgi:hypothetical protein
MYHIGQQICIQTNNGEQLNSTVDIIRSILPLYRKEVILTLYKPYTLYKFDDNYIFNDIYDPVSVTATQPSIQIYRTVLYYNMYNGRYMNSMTAYNGIIHNIIQSILINHSTDTTFAKLRG